MLLSDWKDTANHQLFVLHTLVAFRNGKSQAHTTMLVMCVMCPFVVRSIYRHNGVGMAILP